MPIAINDTNKTNLVFINYLKLSKTNGALSSKPFK